MMINKLNNDLINLITQRSSIFKLIHLYSSRCSRALETQRNFERVDLSKEK